MSLNKLPPLMTAFPAGKRVWHRGDGRCGIVQGWLLFADGSVSVNVDYGSGGNVNEFPIALTFSKEPEDGEGWKTEGKT